MSERFSTRKKIIELVLKERPMLIFEESGKISVGWVQNVKDGTVTMYLLYDENKQKPETSGVYHYTILTRSFDLINREQLKSKIDPKEVFEKFDTRQIIEDVFRYLR